MGEDAGERGIKDRIMEIKAIRGFNDILPDEIGKWQFVEETARKVFERFGFSEIRIPILEALVKRQTSLRRRCIPSPTEAETP